MRRINRHLVGVVGAMVVGGCSGGGGCSSCGVTPLAGGFPEESRIENAASAAITKAGFDFASDNAPAIATTLLGGGSTAPLDFAVPHISGKQFTYDYDVCDPGNSKSKPPTGCTAEVDVAKAQIEITPIAPHSVRAKGSIPVRIKQVPVEATGPLPDFSFIASFGGKSGCPGSGQTFKNVPVEIEVSIEVDQNQSHARAGYTRVVVKKLSADKNAIEDGLDFCDGGIADNIADFVKGKIVDEVYDQLVSTLNGTLGNALCQKAPDCPDGTQSVKGICRYGSKETNECASIVLGTDGKIDLGSLLSSFAPTASGGLEFMLAAGGESKREGATVANGDLKPAAGGASVGFYGGAEPNPLADCVPAAQLLAPTKIPIPDALAAGTAPNWPAGTPGPHFGLGISERFANYAMGSVYDSGLLCLKITTEDIPLLNSATLGLLEDSIADLGIQRETQQLAIAIRPTRPPEVEFGTGANLETDPLVRVRLREANFDFYMFSLDRFSRFMTATLDLDVPVNVSVTPDGLTPVLKKISVENPKLVNADLVRGDKQNLVNALTDLLASQVSQALGSGFSPIDISGTFDTIGLELVIPESTDGKGSPALTKITQGGDDYLGVFAAFAVKGKKAQQKSLYTTADVAAKQVTREGLRWQTWRPDNGPQIGLQLAATLDDGAPAESLGAVEYSYRVDTGVWRPFDRAREVTVDDGWLRTEGRHVISVRSRIVGQPDTLDREPTRVEVVIDKTEPWIALGEISAGVAALEVGDFVSERDALEVRWRLDGGAWSAWTKAEGLAAVQADGAALVEVEARDEEGNVGRAEAVAAAKSELIRDGAAAAASGCACSAVGADEPGAGSARGAGALGALGLLAMARLGRRRKPARATARTDAGARAKARSTVARVAAACATVATLAAVGSMPGCSCGDDTTTSSNSTGAGGGGGGATSSNASTGSGCKVEDCVSLSPGLTGSYTSAVVDGDDVWVAAYSEADWGTALQYGDLVVGKWNDGSKSVEWQPVDGVPAGEVDEKAFDVKGFRGGQTEAGDDVGLWTSIAIVNGSPAVAYYDRTNRALKFARLDGDTWSTQTVQQAANSDIGRYAKLVVVTGKPAIAYLAVEPGEDGAVNSVVRLARASSAAPAEGSWAFEDVNVEEGVPCRPFHCASGTECSAENGLCLASATGCAATCADNEECLDDGGNKACVEVVSKSKIDAYPEVSGAYVAAAVDPSGGIGVAFYDRIRGELNAAKFANSAWSVRKVDGGGSKGDTGIGLSLFIGSNNDWHLTYVDAKSESLRYVRLPGGADGSPAETVDDGLSVAGQAFPEGRHVVGDDSFVFVTPNGDVHVTYQDATAGTLREAIGKQSSQGHTWSTKAYSEPGAFGGAFSRILTTADGLRLMHWARKATPSSTGEVKLVVP